nr:unnamed protein product [Callosobruchus chinensis]
MMCIPTKRISRARGSLYGKT